MLRVRFPFALVRLVDRIRSRVHLTLLVCGVFSFLVTARGRGTSAKTVLEIDTAPVEDAGINESAELALCCVPDVREPHLCLTGGARGLPVEVPGWGFAWPSPSVSSHRCIKRPKSNCLCKHTRSLSYYVTSYLS